MKKSLAKYLAIVACGALAGFVYLGQAFKPRQAAAQANIGPSLSMEYPYDATPTMQSTSGTTGAVTATIAGVAGKTNWVCGISWSASATAGVVNPGSGTGVGGVAGSTSLNLILPILTAPAVGQLTQTFNPCLPASGQNIAVSLVGGAPGAGGNSTATIWGFQR